MEKKINEIEDMIQNLDISYEMDDNFDKVRYDEIFNLAKKEYPDMEDYFLMLATMHCLKESE